MRVPVARRRSRATPPWIAGAAIFGLAQCSVAAEALVPGSAAASGAEVYAAQCASCHGAEGEGYIGPPVMGDGAALEPYANGKRLLDYIRATMPQTNPGGLSEEAYRQVLAYLLVRNGFAEPGWSPETQPPEQVTLER